MEGKGSPPPPHFAMHEGSVLLCPFFFLSPAAAKGELSERGTGDSLRLGDPLGRKRVGEGRGFIYSTSVLFFSPCAGSDCPNERTDPKSSLPVTKAPLSEVGERQWLRPKSPPPAIASTSHPGYATQLSSRLPPREGGDSKSEEEEDLLLASSPGGH